jgi:hypothetical protein
MDEIGFSAKDHRLFLSTVLSGKASGNLTCSVICKLPPLFGDMVAGL